MSVPLSRLASLDQLRGFVAAGRRMSITEAARDLCLSQSAVSRQISALEEMLGTALLVRKYRAIAFTPEGERLFRVADSALQQVQDVLATLGSAREGMPVTITASIGVTTLWLLPRLVGFQRQYPTVDVRFSTNNKLLDMRTENIDLAIRYCSATGAPEGSRRLFSESVVPVAHPSLGLERLESAEAIEAQVLIEFDDVIHPWLRWPSFLDAAGYGQVRPKAVLRFNQYDQVIQAAVAGQGIALGRMPLVQSMLADKRLIALGKEIDLSPGYGYWLIRAETSPRKDVLCLAEWIESEASASQGS
jgi:LysR family transcriptional regulator, glycine cleavage system transcriptional activator